MRKHPPSFYIYQKKWLKEHPIIKFFGTPILKKRIESVAKEKNITQSKFLFDIVSQSFSPDYQKQLLGRVIRDEIISKAQAEAKMIRANAKRMVEEELNLDPIKEGVCTKKGCKGEMRRLLYLQKTGNGEIEIKIPRVIICEKCGSIKEG